MSIIPRQLPFAGGGGSCNPGNAYGVRFSADLRSIAELPEQYRGIFKDYASFNIVQSKTLDDVLYTDASVVVSAPTGSGKTGVFELAIVRMLMALENTPYLDLFKIVYLSPMKALCEERLIDWNRKFQNFNINCISVTGDSDLIEFQHLLNHNLIITTPEKWDSLTRRWKDNKKLVQVVKLFMIDEVHLLHEETRGATLEVVVCRMKTIQDSLTSSECDPDIAKYKVRFVAASATVANIEDVADWIGRPPNVKHFKFSDDMRPVKLKKIVLGYRSDPKSTWFKFDLMLNYKLQSLLMQHADGKPCLIFCSTRKIVEMTAKHLVQHLTICLRPEQKERLIAVANGLSDVKVKEMLVNGVAYHHAGMLPQNRHAIEHLFRSGDLPVLVTSRTLAMGVNLPAHLVIIKSTKVYDKGGYTDYTETAISQMIGRAGRPQFDTSATALILTSLKDKEKYEKMVGGTDPVESNLHRHLTEHLNAEVVLHTITDLDVALKWLSSTFLYIRARKNPRHYGLPVGMTSEETDKRLLDMTKTYINKLVKAGMLNINGEQQTLTPTTTGQLMAKYCLAFETVKLFTEIKGDEVLQQIVALISKCHEFSDMFLRNNDKKCLNLLNKNRTGESIRFPLTGKIKTLDMKINCVLQAILGCLDIGDHSILTETLRITRHSERIVTCLIEYLKTRKNCYSALLNTIVMAKCIRTRLWENSPHICKQFAGIGIVMSSQMVKAGKTTIEAISKITGREIEFILNKKPPMGSNILDQILHLPNYTLTLQNVDNKSIQLIVTLENAEALMKKSTANIKSCMCLIAGDSLNNVLHYEKLTHSQMIRKPEIVRFVDVPGGFERVEAHLISEDWVGFDCQAAYETPGCKEAVEKMQPAKTRNKSAKKAVPAASTVTGGSYMENFLRIYQRQTCAKLGNKQPEEEAVVVEEEDRTEDAEEQSEKSDENKNAPDDAWDDDDDCDAIENPMSSGKSDNHDEQFWDDEEIDTLLQSLDKGMENLESDDVDGHRQLLLDKAYNEIWGKNCNNKEDTTCEAGTLNQMKEQLDDFVDFDNMFPKTQKVTDENPVESKEEDYWKELEVQYNNLRNDGSKIPNSEQQQQQQQQQNDIIVEPHFLMGNMNQEYLQEIAALPKQSALQPRRFSPRKDMGGEICGTKDDATSTRQRCYSSTATNNQPIIDVASSNNNRERCRFDAAESRNDDVGGGGKRLGQMNYFERQIWGSDEVEQQRLDRYNLYSVDRPTSNDWKHDVDLMQHEAETPRQLAIERHRFESDLTKSERSKAAEEKTANFDGKMGMFEDNNSKPNMIKAAKWSKEESQGSEPSKRIDRVLLGSRSTPNEEIQDFAVAEQTRRTPLRNESRSKPSTSGGSLQGQRDEKLDQHASQSFVKRKTYAEQIWESVPQEEPTLKGWSEKENLGSNKWDVSRDKIDASTGRSKAHQGVERNNRGATSRSVVSKKNTFEELWGSVRQTESNVNSKADEGRNRSDLLQGVKKSKPLMEVFDQAANQRSEDDATGGSSRHKEANVGRQIEQQKSKQDKIEEDQSQRSFVGIQIRKDDERKPCHKRKQTQPKRTPVRQLRFTDIQDVVKEPSPPIEKICKRFRYTPRKKITTSTDNDEADDRLADNRPQKLDVDGSPNGGNNSPQNDDDDNELPDENPNRKITWRSPLIFFSPAVLHTPKLGKINDTSSPPQSASTASAVHSHALSVKDDIISQSLASTGALKTPGRTPSVKYQQKCDAKPKPLPLSDSDYRANSKDNSRDNAINDLDGSLDRTSFSQQSRRGQVEMELATPKYKTSSSQNDFYSQILKKYDTPRPEPLKQSSPIEQKWSPKMSLPSSRFIQNNDGLTVNLEPKPIHTQDSYYAEMMKNYQQNLEKQAAKNAKSRSTTTTSAMSCSERHSPVETFESFRSGLEALRTANNGLLDCTQFSNGSRTNVATTEDSGVNSETMMMPLPVLPCGAPTELCDTSSRSNYEMNLSDDERFDMNASTYQGSMRSGFDENDRQLRPTRQYYQRPLVPSSASRGAATIDSGINSWRPPPVAFRELPPRRGDYGTNRSYEPADMFEYNRDRYNYESSIRFGYDTGMDYLPPIRYSRPFQPQVEPFFRLEPRRYEPYQHRELYRPIDVPYRDYDCRSQRYEALPVPPPSLAYSQPRSTQVSYRPRMVEQEAAAELPREPIVHNYMIRRYFSSMDEGRGEEEAADDEFFCFNN